MIVLTTPTGTRVAFNPDLIERVETSPPTTLVMTTGKRHEVREDVDAIVARVREWRASVIELTDYLEISAHPTAGHTVVADVAPSLSLVEDEPTNAEGDVP